MANLLALASSLYSIQVFNRYIGYGLDGTLIALTTGATLALFLEFLFRSLRTRLLSSVIDPQDGQANFSLLQRLLVVPNDVMAQKNPQYVYQVMKQLQQLQQTQSVQNLLVFIDFPFALIFIFAVFLLLPALGLVVCLAAASSLLVLWWWQRRAANQQMAMQEAAQAYDASVARTLSHTTISAFNSSDYIAEQHQQPLINWLKKRSVQTAQQLAMQQSTQLISGLTSVAVIGFGAVAVSRGAMDIGSLIGANILASRAISIINQTAKAAQNLAQAQSLQTEVDEALALEPEAQTGATPMKFEGNIALKAVTHGYDPRQAPFLNGLNLQVKAGDCLAVCGRNGSGKSTIANIVTGLLTPSQGQVLADGVDIRQLLPRWWRSQIAYVPQEPLFLNTSLYDNLCALRWPEKPSDEHFQSVIQRCGLQAFIDRHPDGIQQQIVASGANLPLGLRKRLALARAIMFEPQLLVLDEVHEGLDAAGRKTLAEVIQQSLANRKTVLLFSSDQSMVGPFVNSFDLNTGAYKPKQPVAAGANDKISPVDGAR